MVLTMRHNGQGLTGDEVDFEGSWKVLSSSLREIHTKNASRLSFEELYRNAYKIVLKKKGEVLYDRVKSFEQEWLSGQVRERIKTLITASLVSNTDEGAAGTSANERRAAGERFLRGLKQAWEDHQVCMNMTTDVLMYMVRVQMFTVCVRQHAKPTDNLSTGSGLLYGSASAIYLRGCHGFVSRLHPAGPSIGPGQECHHHIYTEPHHLGAHTYGTRGRYGR